MDMEAYVNRLRKKKNFQMCLAIYCLPVRGEAPKPTGAMYLQAFEIS